MVKKEEASRSRKSARLCALDEKSRILSVQKLTKASSSSPPAAAAARRRGRKRKSLQAVVTHSVTASPPQEGEEVKPEDNATEAEQTENSLSLSVQRMPTKEALEFILDILQRRDPQEIFAQPVDPQEVVGYYSIIKEPMDFGTMRAKLQEGLYTSLEQFERDVFLICSNAMKFNSSTTVYYTAARVINEVAQRLFHALRTSPESFQLEYSRTRRRPGTRRPLKAAGGLHSRSSRSARYKAGVSINDPSHKRTTHSLTQYKPYIGKTSFGIIPVTDDGESSESASERRMTYLSQNSSRTENEKLVSTVYNAPKPVVQVSNAGAEYVDSLMKFVEDLGPEAQTVANKKLGKLPIEAPNVPSWTSTPVPPFGSTADSLLPSPSALQNPAYLTGCQVPSNAISNPLGSYKEKTASTDGREVVPSYNSSTGAKPQTNDGGLIDYNLLGGQGSTKITNTNACASSSSDNIDLLCATLMQIAAMQNRTNHAPSGTYFPLTGHEDVPPAQSSKLNNASHSWMLNSLSQPTSLPYQTSAFSSTSKATSSSSLSGFPNGAGMSTSAPAATALDLLDWKQSEATWGLPAICDLPVLPAQANNQMPKTQNVFMQQPAQVPSTQAKNQIPTAQSVFMQQPTQVPSTQVSNQSPVTQSVFLQQTAQVPPTQAKNQIPTTRSVFFQQPAQVPSTQASNQIPATRSVFLQQTAQVPSIQQANNLIPTTENVFMQHPARVPSTQAKNQIPTTQSVFLQQTAPVPSTQAGNQIPTTQSLFLQQTAPVPSTQAGDYQIPTTQSVFFQQTAPVPSNQASNQIPKAQGVYLQQPGQVPLTQQANNLMPATQNVFMQVPPTQEKQVFNATNFAGGANPQGHQAESSTQSFWNALRASLMDNKNVPDLDLQL